MSIKKENLSLFFKSKITQFLSNQILAMASEVTETISAVPDYEHVLSIYPGFKSSIAGICGGALSSLITQPFDIVKVIFTCQNLNH